MTRKGLLLGLGACLLVLSACDADPQIEVPTARLASPAARVRGAVIYADQCASCHGPRGKGRGVRSYALGKRADFSLPAWRRTVTPAQVFQVVKRGRDLSAMPPARNLDDDEIWDVTAYVLSIHETG